MAVDPADQRLFQPHHAIDDVARFLHLVVPLGMVGLFEALDHFCDIAACGKGAFACAGEDDNVGLAVVVDIFEYLRELPVGNFRSGIERRIFNRDDKNPPAPLDLQLAIFFVHQAAPKIVLTE